MAEKKLDAALIEKAHKLISEGHYAVVVCAYLGISEAIYYKWIQRAKEDQSNNQKSIYVEFFESIKEAEAKAEMRHLQTIAKAATEGNWQASAWFLKTKHRDRWSERQEVTLQGDPEKPLEIKTQWEK